jgi:hypothetical protein
VFIINVCKPGLNQYRNGTIIDIINTVSNKYVKDGAIL